MSVRQVRDILAESMRRERLGLIRPLWAEWQTFADGECEQVRRRADQLMRLLAELGVELVQKDAPAPLPEPASRVIYRHSNAGLQAERLIRLDDDGRWSIVRVAAGVETVEQTFALSEAHLNSGLVLTDDPAAKTIPGLGRQLAAALEIHRVNASRMAP